MIPHENPFPHCSRRFVLALPVSEINGVRGATKETNTATPKLITLFNLKFIFSFFVLNSRLGYINRFVVAFTVSWI